MKFDEVIALGGYDDAIRDAVLRMKRPNDDFLSAAMGELLALQRGDDLSQLKPDLVVPIPMYWTRRLRRGTNSPGILARRVARFCGAPFRRVLVRGRNTLPQAGLPPRQRWKNVRGAFRVRNSRRVCGRRILLIDDILTTGATCSEAADVLKRAGAAAVAVAVIARAQGANAT